MVGEHVGSYDLLYLMRIATVNDTFCTANLAFRLRKVDSESWLLDADIDTHLGYCLDKKKSHWLFVIKATISVLE